MKNLSTLIILLILNWQRLDAEIVTVSTIADSESNITTNFAFQATSTAYTNTYSVVTNGNIPVGTVSVRAGETAKFLFASGGNITYQIGEVTIGLGLNCNSAMSQPGPIFVGPGSFSLTGSGTAGCRTFLTVQITRNDEVFVPSGSVLVPADSSGPVSVILESSTNLVAWSSALPGTYGTTSQNQYFRVRALRQTP